MLLIFIAYNNKQPIKLFEQDKLVFSHYKKNSEQKNTTLSEIIYEHSGTETRSFPSSILSVFIN